MRKAPTKTQISTDSIKRYLTRQGYEVRVQAAKRPTRQFKHAFDVYFSDSKPVPDALRATLSTQFPDFAGRISTTRVFLSDVAWTKALPYFSPAFPTTSHSSGEKVNTQSDAEAAHVRASLSGAVHALPTSAEPVATDVPIRRTRSQIVEENAAALELLNAADFDTRIFSANERTLLENYAGAGSQYSEDVKSDFRANVDALTQFYTPAFAAERMYEIAYGLGFPRGGKVLEPSCGVGRLIKPTTDYSQVTAFEVSDIPYRIARKLYPEADIHNLYFEQAFLQQPRYTTTMKNPVTWLKGYPFDLVIGNPPYGKHTNKYQGSFSKRFPQIEFFFMYYAAKLLKSGGLLMYVTSSNFLRNGLSYNSVKEQLFELLSFETAYRMPNKFIELTDVSSDILIFRRK